MKTTQKSRVLLAMSGGVDSSVAALLLKKKGYEIIGAFMKNYSNTKNNMGECAWRQERRIAIKIAAMLNIPLITLDFEKQYKKLVVDEMFKLYKKGRTPNPDIDCNEKIKFPLLLKAAKKMKINLIATGHYARKRYNSKKRQYELLRGKDNSKDQSYFLYQIKQNELSSCLFPIGDYTKNEIREIAQKNNFQNYNKKGTVGICFVGKINLKEFLKKKIKPKKGKILNPEGEVIGYHDGIYYYTIGQRLGPRYGFEIQRKEINKKEKSNEPLERWYVAKKDIKNNIIIAAPKDHPLNFKGEIIVKDLHLISDNKKEFQNKSTKVFSRIRHVGELLPSKLIYNKKSKRFQVRLDKPITGISEGQAIVLYQGEKVLGGGEIKFN